MGIASRIWGCALMVAACAAAVAGNAQLPDVLSREAGPAARSASRVMLAITRAGDRLVSAGERGIVLLSDNHGQSWRQAKVPVSVSLTNVRFVSAKEGWAVGHSGVVLHTDDGGVTWRRQLDGNQAAEMMSEANKTAAQGGDEAAQKAAAEAKQWVTDGPDKPLLDLHFWDAQRGLVVGAYGMAFATQDGGKSWKAISARIPNPQSLHLYRIHATAQSLYIVGERGALFRSTDGGATFAKIATPYVGTYFGLLTGAGEELIAFGLRGNLYWSGDAGRTWQKRESGTAAPIVDGLRLTDGTLLLLSQSGDALLSQDQGHTFRKVTLAHLPASGIAQAADGSLVMSGLRGVQRFAAPTKRME